MGDVESPGNSEGLLMAIYYETTAALDSFGYVYTDVDIQYVRELARLPTTTPRHGDTRD